MKNKLLLIICMAVFAFTSCLEVLNDEPRDCTVYLIDKASVEAVDSKILQSKLLASSIKEAEGCKVCLTEEEKNQLKKEVEAEVKMTIPDEEHARASGSDYNSKRENDSWLRSLINDNFRTPEFSFPNIFDFLIK